MRSSADQPALVVAAAPSQFFGSNAGGLQCNLDPKSSLDAAFRERPKNFPDGRGINFIIEENVIDDGMPAALRPLAVRAQADIGALAR